MNTIAKLSIVACGALVATTATAGGYYDHGRHGYEDNYSAYIGVNVGECRGELRDRNASYGDDFLRTAGADD